MSPKSLRNLGNHPIQDPTKNRESQIGSRSGRSGTRLPAQPAEVPAVDEDLATGPQRIQVCT